MNNQLTTLSQGRTRAIVMVQGEEVKVNKNRRDWKGLIAMFIACQDVKESSRKLYVRTLSQYFLWLKATSRNIDTLTREDILEYKDSLAEQKLSTLTISSYITAVRKFYEWAEAEKIYPNIAKAIKTPKRKQAFKKQHLTDDKSAELLQHFQDVSLRDYAIVNLILRTGLRTIEVVRANVEDITFMGNRRVLKVWGKGRDDKSDFVILTDKAFEPIKAYLATRKGAKGAEPLFTSTSHQNNGQRLTTRTISGLCKDGLKAIGLDGREFTAHSLRHTTGCAMLKHGANLMDVQFALRHSDPKTTQIYVESITTEHRLANAPTDLLDNAF